MEFKDAVKYLRSELGITQVELAMGLHMNAITVGRWENGHTVPARSISAVLIDYARSEGASNECIEILTKSLNNAARSKLDFSGDGFDILGQASLRQLIDDSGFPIYVSDTETYELMYLNRKANEIAGSEESAVGKKCYECLMHLNAPCEFCHISELSEDKTKSYDFCRISDSTAYRMQAKLIHWNGRLAQARRITGQEDLTKKQADGSDETAKQLETIFDNINAGVSALVYEDNGSVSLAYVNEYYYELFGYTKEQFYEKFKAARETVHPDDREYAVAMIAWVKEKKQAATFRYRIVRRDGSIAYLCCDCSVTTMDGVSGYVLISILTDITKAAFIEEQASASGQFTDATIKKIDGAVTASVINPDGTIKIQFSNELYYGMLGYTEKQFKDEVSDPFMLTHPEDMDDVRRTALSLHNIKDTKELSYRAITRDGEIKWIRAYIYVVAFPNVASPVQLAVYTDFTDITKARAKLNTLQNEIADSSEDTAVGITVVNVDRRDISGTLNTVYYNERLIRFTGYGKDEYEALIKENNKAPVFESDVPVVLSDVEKLCNGKIGASFDRAVRCNKKDGKCCWLLLTGQLAKRRKDNCTVNFKMIDITDRQEAIDRQRISNEMFRIAAETDQRAMITYDVKKNTCHVESRKLFSAKYNETITNIPQSIIERSIVAQGSVDEFCALFDRIRKGERKIRVSLQMRSRQDKYDWFECNATTVVDAEGNPDRTVMIFHNITEQRVKEAVFRKWRQFVDSRPPETYTLFSCNLSRDAVLDEHDGSLLKVKLPREASSFNSKTKLYAEKFVYQDDRENYIKVLDSDLLLAMFYRGEHFTTHDYREVAENGDISWRRLTIETVERPNSTDVQAFLLYEDIDAEIKAEIAAKELTEADPLTGALNGTAFSGRVDKIISESPNIPSALLVLDMDGFKQLNDAFGRAAGDQALREVADVLRSYLRSGDLVCRLGGDEFTVLLRDIPYDAVIGKTAQHICEYIGKAYSREVQLSASIGIAVYPRDGKSYDELYHNAKKALYSVKESGKGSHAFFSVAGEEPAVKTGEKTSAENQSSASFGTTKHRMLIVDDNEINRMILKNIFENDFIIETAKNGAEAVTQLHRYGVSVSVVLLDLLMPDMDGFAVLRKIRNDIELRTIPVIVVTSDDDHNTLLKALELGAAEYVSKPVDPDIIRMRVQSVISKADSERLRAQNSYLMLQRDEEAKYHTVLDSTGTVVIEYDRRTHVFIYGGEISKYIAGKYDRRSLWEIFLSDTVADGSDVRALRDTLSSFADNKEKNRERRLVKLKTPSNDMHWFRMNVYKNTDEAGVAEKLIITFNDVHEEVLANDRLMFQATRDALTGLYNRTAFLEKAAELISGEEPGYYVISCIDIERFQVINDRYGTETGDEVLKHIANAVGGFVEKHKGICCRYAADKFAVLFPTKLLKTAELEENHKIVASPACIPHPLHLRMGRCLANDTSLSISAMFDRAAMAETVARGLYKTNIVDYDETMRDSIMLEQQIVGDMVDALKNGEFEPWLQPQYNHITGALIGAEALVRWRKDGKVISPDEFIKIFEKNGFIYEMDRYIWRKVCALLRRWLDEDKNPLPLSVNISRYDIVQDDFVSVITSLIAEYRLPTELLRLEITESAFSSDTNIIIDIAGKLISAGFTVEIDDFGSGYSSLNTLKDVPATILKLDMRFFETSENSSRGGSIVESVVRMAKWLGMSVIAEGVESREQADYLKSIGCYYIQGYYYSMPLTVEEYEKKMQEDPAERRLSSLEMLETLDADLFWDPKSMETLIFNSYVGGACIFEFHNEETELLRYNDQFITELRGLVPKNSEIKDVSVTRYLDGKGKKELYKVLKSALVNGREVSCVLCLKNGGQTEYVRQTSRVIAKTDDRTLYYSVIQNLTTQRRLERERAESAEQLTTIMSNVNCGVSASLYHSDDNIEIVYANEGFYKIFGYTEKQFRDEITDITSPILPDDKDRIISSLARILHDRGSVTYEYSCRRRDGTVVRVQTTNSVISFAGIGDTVLLAVTTDITELRSTEEKIIETADRLSTVMDSMINGITAVTIQPQMQFLLANNRYYQMHGVEKQDFTENVFNSAILTVHPDDRRYVRDIVRKTKTIGQREDFEYRTVLPDGSLHYMKAEISVINLVNISSPVQVTVYTDITEEKKANEQLRFLNESASYILSEPDGEKAINNTLKRLLNYFAAERTYVFELNDATRTSDNTYELCAPGIRSERKRLQGVAYEIQQYWFDAFSKTGFVVIPDVSAMNEREEDMKKLLLFQKIKSIIVAPLWRMGKLIGYLGVDNPTNAVDQVGRLIAIAYYIAILLTRRDLTKTIERERQTTRQLMDDTPGGFLRIELFKDKTPAIVTFNEGLCNMLDMTRQEIMETYGDNALLGLAAEDAVSAPIELERSYRAGNQYTNTCRLVKKDGTLFWVMLFGRFVKDEDGRLYLNAYFTDITEKKSLEQQQCELLENLPVGAALCEYDGEKVRLIHVNKHYCDLIKRPPLNTEKIFHFGAFHPDDRAIVIDELKSAIRQGRNAACMARIICGDGSYKLFRVITNNVRENDGNYLLYTTFTVISDADMAIQEILPITLTSIVSNTDALSYVKDKELRYVCVSQAIARQAGVESPRDFVGKKTTEMFGTADPEKFEQDDRGIIENGKPIVHMLERIPTKDGSICIARTSKFPILDAKGNAVGIYCISQDITAQKEKESQLELLTKTIPGGLAAFSLSDGRFATLYFNDGFFGFSGYTREEYVSMTEKEPLALILPEDRHIMLTMVRGISAKTKDGMTDTCTYRCLTKSGEIRWMSLKAVVSQMGDNDFVLYAVQLDITERVNESKRENDLLDNLPFGAAMYEFDGKTIDAVHINRRYKEMVNRDVDISIKNYTPTSGIHPDDRIVAVNALNSAIAENRNASCDIRLLYGTGGYRLFHLDARIVPMENGKYMVYVAYELITDRDKELKETSERLKLLSESIPGGIATFRCMPGNIEMIYYNDGICKLTGYSREEFNTGKMSVLGLVTDEDKPIIRKQIELLIGGKMSLNYSVRIRIKSGEIKWVECAASLTGQEHKDVFIVSAVITDVTEQQLEHERLRVSEEVNRLAIDQSGTITTRYDVAARTLTLPYSLPDIFALPRVLENMPDEQVRLGRISPDTADAYCSVFTRINNGELSGETVYQQKSTVGWRWMKSLFTTVRSDDGKPVSAVITFEDITEQRDKEAIYTRWQNAMAKRSEDSYTLVRCNLNKAISMDSWEGNLLRIRFSDPNQHFNSLTLEYANEYVCPEDRAAFCTFLNSDTLLAEYHRGHRSDSIDYREQNDDGSIRWLRLNVDMVEYPDSKDVEAYMLFENIDEQKVAELSTIRRAETDPLTGVFNRAAFAERVNGTVKNIKPKNSHALFMLDIDGFKRLNDIFGHGAGDKALTEVAKSLMHICRKEDLVGRLGGDEFFVFLSDTEASEAAKKAQQICDMARKANSSGVSISLSVGIALYPKDGDCFDALYKSADKALYRTKNAGKDGYSFTTGKSFIRTGIKQFGNSSSDNYAFAKKGRRVLIVSDNEKEKAALEAALKGDYNIEKLKDGASALSILHRYGTAVSIALLDLSMPGMSCFELLDAIQQDERIRIIPVIVISDNEDRETVLRAIRAGASEIITKPIDADVLRLRIESAIGKAENERMRAQSNYLLVRNSEVNGYRTALEHMGTAVIAMDLFNGEFSYSPTVSKELSGQYDTRPLWDILACDEVADAKTVQTMETLVKDIAKDKERTEGSITVWLKSAAGAYTSFDMDAFKENDSTGSPARIILTLSKSNADTSSINSRKNKTT